jgi:hypothetical protein
MKLGMMAGIGILVLGLAGTSHAGEADKVGYPEGYRGWQHVKSMVIKPGHPLENPFLGIHHVYGNDKAIQGLRDGKFQDGALLVFDLLDYTDTGDSLQEAGRKLVGVMARDAKKYAATGGWGYEGFAGDSRSERLTKDGGKSCYDCHASQQATGYVFSRLRN